MQNELIPPTQKQIPFQRYEDRSYGKRIWTNLQNSTMRQRLAILVLNAGRNAS